MFEQNNMSPGFHRIQATRLERNLYDIDAAISHLTDTRNFQYNILDLLYKASNPDNKSIEKIINFLENLKLERSKLNMYEQLITNELKYYLGELHKYEEEISSAEIVAYGVYCTPTPQELKKEKVVRASKQIFRYIDNCLTRAR